MRKVPVYKIELKITKLNIFSVTGKNWSLQTTFSPVKPFLGLRPLIGQA